MVAPYFLMSGLCLGHQKTIGGIVLSILITTGFAPVIALDWKIELVVASVAMAGDLFSSFLKRKLRFQPSSRATGLDQIPESLFPALACRSMLDLSAIDTAAAVVIFFVGEIVLSRLLFKWHVRDRPF